MTKPITTYKELLEEKARLKLLLEDQKQLLRNDIAEIKEEFAPVKKAISIAGKFVTRDNSNWVLTTAAETAIDVIFRRLILSKAGFAMRIVLPFLMKNFSSHVLADNKNKIFSKLFSWIGKKNANGKMHHPEKDAKEALADEEQD